MEHIKEHLNRQMTVKLNKLMTITGGKGLKLLFMQEG